MLRGAFKTQLPQEYGFLSDLEEEKSECTVWCALLTYYKQSARHNAKACAYITVAQIVPSLPPSSLYEGHENPRWSQPLWPDLAAWAGETAAKVQGLQSSLLPRGGTVSRLPAPVRHRLQNYNSHKRAHRPVSSPLSFLTNHTSRISGKRFQFPKSFLDAQTLLLTNSFLLTVTPPASLLL